MAIYLAGVNVTDSRVSRGDEKFTEALEKSPGRCLPVLMIGNMAFCESLAITRYAAALGGLCLHCILEQRCYLLEY